MIDSHCHLNFSKLSEKIEDIVYNSKKNNITSILSINTKPEEFNDHINLIQNYKLSGSQVFYIK